MSCPIELIIGIPCPGCGLTRAMLALCIGNWTASVDLHPLASVVLLQISLLGVLAGKIVGFGTPRARLTNHVPVWLLSLNVWAFSTVWLMRLCMGTLPR